MSKDVIKKLRDAVIQGDEDKARELAREAVKIIDPVMAFEEGLVAAINEMGERWAREEVFLTEVLLSANAMKAGSAILQEKIREMGEVSKTLGKVLIGTVKGDIHDLGKNIVVTLLEAAGFTVYDLGVDVGTETFIEKIKELKPDIVGLSSLMTVTIPEQKMVIEALKKAGLRDKVKVLVGGAPVTETWAREIGADGYGSDALAAVSLAKKLVGET